VRIVVGRVGNNAATSGAGTWNARVVAGTRQFVGLEIDWPEVEARYEEFGLTPAAPSQASRVAVPVYLGEKQVGKATTTTWSPVLKKMIALASVDTAHSQIGTKLQLEITIEAMRQQVTAKIVKMPFFNPERKTATPV